ncbi:stationary phase survival protein SurE [Oceanobacter sp. RED65]|uniref:5'-nucleotidase SurE n=1 Tax=Bermanella marisrubri TaxID=207949 RepID=Q1N1K4_9GAMM|nr:stationary phase survival protein SurE [Oceanobacter sp. RED65] [Bermanella marisrubri]
MKILLSNDDGVYAPGLQTLAKYCQDAGYDIQVVAPDRDRSGASNSLTLDRPLHPTYLDNGFISVNGTPTDCVHLGISQFTDHNADLVISGINRGANLGDDVIYSGTVAAAMEGRFLVRFPIAISLAGTQFFDTAARVLMQLLPDLLQLQLPARTLLNINVPDVAFDELKGVAITRLGHRHRSDNPVKTENPRGKECYWISAVGNVADNAEDTDFYAIEHNFVSITPIHVDMTHHESLQSLRGLKL